MIDLPIIPCLLTLPPLYLIYTLIFPPISPNTSLSSSHHQSYNWHPSSHPTVLLFKNYSPLTLRKYDGVDPAGKGRILLAIGGEVYDVTNGAKFYGPDGMYGNFAGRDASRGMAKQSFDIEMLTPIDQRLDTLSDITKAEDENMKGWMDHFRNKYTICGKMVENGSEDPDN